MAKLRDKKRTSKVFNWKLETRDAIEALEEFQLLVLTEGKTDDHVFLELVKSYNKKNKKRFTILSEPDLLLRLEREGYSVTRQTLKKYRDQGLLVNSANQKLWFTDGISIAYNFEAVLKFIKARRG
jgi:hypothetical protein